MKPWEHLKVDHKLTNKQTEQTNIGSFFYENEPNERSLKEW